MDCGLCFAIVPADILPLPSGRQAGRRLLPMTHQRMCLRIYSRYRREVIRPAGGSVLMVRVVSRKYNSPCTVFYLPSISGFVYCVRSVILLLLVYNSSVFFLCAWCDFAFAAVFFSSQTDFTSHLLLCFFCSIFLSLLSCCCFFTALLFCCCSFAFYSPPLCCTVSAFSAGFSLDFEGDGDIERKVAAGTFAPGRVK